LQDYKGVRGLQAHTKGGCRGRRACRQLFMKAVFVLAQKKTSDLEITEHSGRTQLSHPASQLASPRLSL